MKNFSQKLLLAGFVAASASAFASPIALNGFSGTESVLDFATLGGAPSTGPFMLGVATFSEASTGSGGPGWRLFGAGSFGNPQAILTDNAGTTNITVDFATNYDRIGFYVSIGDATYTVDFFDGATLLGTELVAVVGLTSKFVGFENLSGGVSRAVIRETSGDNGRVGGLMTIRYEDVAGGTVPEPATMGLVLFALVGAAAARRIRCA